MSHKILRPFIVKVSVLGYFPLYNLYIVYIYIYIYIYICIISLNIAHGIVLTYSEINVFK